LVGSVALGAKSQKTFVKSVSAETASVLELQMPGKVKIISVTVDLNISEEILKHLTSVARRNGSAPNG
jgi:hypothetical protein